MEIQPVVEISKRGILFFVDWDYLLSYHPTVVFSIGTRTRRLVLVFVLVVLFVLHVVVEVAGTAAAEEDTDTYAGN